MRAVRTEVRSFHYSGGTSRRKRRKTRLLSTVPVDGVTADLSRTSF